MVNDNVFRYRIVTNFHCNQNCYFCFQPEKSKKILDISKMEEVMSKVGHLKRATIMGGESLLLDNVVDYFKIVNQYVDTICLVTNGTKITKPLLEDLISNGLEEMAISISSMEQYAARHEQIMIAKELVPNLRINLPKSFESTGQLLYNLIIRILNDGIFVVVCEDLMNRYNTIYKDILEDLTLGMGAKIVSDDGHNFYILEYQGKQFGLFGYHGNSKANRNSKDAGYEKTDIIITPDCHSDDMYSCKVYSVWETYCNDIGNYDLS